jgi:hypothetical protein
MKKAACIVAALLLIAFTTGSVQAKDMPCKIDTIGFDVQYGRDSADELQGDHSLNIVERISVRAESDSLITALLNDSWDKWTIGAEIHYSSHKANERPDHEQDTGFHETGVNLTLKRHLLNKIFYIGCLAGLSYVSNFPEFENRSWNDNDLRSNIGRSHYLYTLGVLTGKDWQVLKSAWSVRTEVRLTHTSDPFRSDRGKNFAAGVLGATYRF